LFFFQTSFRDGDTNFPSPPFPPSPRDKRLYPKTRGIITMLQRSSSLPLNSPKIKINRRRTDLEETEKQLKRKTEREKAEAEESAGNTRFCSSLWGSVPPPSAFFFSFYLFPPHITYRRRAEAQHK
jgi:hypothetical protein